MIEYKFRQGNSPNGYSDLNKYLKCPKRYVREEATRLLPTNDQILEFADPDDGYAVGTVFHAIAEMYHTRVLSAPELASPIRNFSTPNARISAPVLAEAVRLFKHYQICINEPHYLGEVLGAEVPISIEGSLIGRLDSKPFTGYVDLITRVSEADFKRLLTSFPDGQILPIEVPGVYFWDWKTQAAERRFLEPYFSPAWQMESYLLSAQHQHQEWDIAGGFTIVLIKTKVPKLRFYYTPFPSEDRQLFHKSLWARRRALEVLNHPPNPSEAACAGAYTLSGSPCPLYRTECHGI